MRAVRARSPRRAGRERRQENSLVRLPLRQQGSTHRMSQLRANVAGVTRPERNQHEPSERPHHERVRHVALEASAGRKLEPEAGVGGGEVDREHGFGCFCDGGVEPEPRKGGLERFGIW